MKLEVLYDPAYSRALEYIIHVLPGTVRGWGC
jgi:hypothetical protein